MKRVMKIIHKTEMDNTRDIDFNNFFLPTYIQFMRFTAILYRKLEVEN